MAFPTIMFSFRQGRLEYKIGKLWKNASSFAHSLCWTVSGSLYSVIKNRVFYVTSDHASVEDTLSLLIEPIAIRFKFHLSGEKISSQIDKVFLFLSLQVQSICAIGLYFFFF